MANVKITELPQVSSLLGTDILPTVASSATSKITVTDLANSLPQVSSSISASYLSGSSAIVTSLTSSLNASIGGINIGRGANLTLGNVAVAATLPSASGGSNVAIGLGALNNLTTGNDNVSIGPSSLLRNTTGQQNIGLGPISLFQLSTGSRNIAAGSNALRDLVNGTSNIAIGFLSGRGLVTGSYNVVIGGVIVSSSLGVVQADISNNVIIGDGQGNIRAWHNATSWSFFTPVVAPQGITASLFGTSSWAENTISSSYVSGSSAIVTNLTSSNDALINGLTFGKGGGNTINLAIGDRALANNTSGTQNTAIGTLALSASIVGAGNTAVGYQSMQLNTSNNNTALGWRSLYLNTIGSANIAVGTSALVSNTSGSNNVAIGLQALLGSTTGNGNTAIGYRAGYGTGVNNNTTGGNNIFIGNISVGVTGSDSNRTWIGNTSTTSTWLGGNLLLGQTDNFGSRLQVTGDASITGSVQISSILTLAAQDLLPSGVATGSIAVSGSGIDCKPYFWNGSTWTSMI
jgi:hypothetical protein